jgi:hypothetical protein
MTEPAYERLHASATHARHVLERLSAAGGILGQIEAGEWDAVRSPDQAGDLAAQLDALAEHARDARAFGGGQPFELDPADRALGRVTDAAASRLPMNRKERFYTGTVLPMLIASDGFAYLDRFLARCGLPVHVEGNRLGDQDLQLFTEYGFAESVFTDADREHWPDPAGKNTPDVVLTGPDWLLAVEAKVFHNPNAAALNRQMRDQQVIVRAWQSRLGLPGDRVRHVLLLPDRLARRVGPLEADVVTWEDLLADYRPVGPAHWIAVLDTALRRHKELESRDATFGRNAQDKLTGAEILAAHGEGTLAYDHMGRTGGVEGAAFREDLATGRWRTTLYEVRDGTLPGNLNWFRIEELIALTAREGTA